MPVAAKIGLPPLTGEAAPSPDAAGADLFGTLIAGIGGETMPGAARTPVTPILDPTLTHVIPAKAGIQSAPTASTTTLEAGVKVAWIPASAGLTDEVVAGETPQAAADDEPIPESVAQLLALVENTPEQPKLPSALLPTEAPVAGPETSVPATPVDPPTVQPPIQPIPAAVAVSATIRTAPAEPATIAVRATLLKPEQAEADASPAPIQSAPVQGRTRPAPAQPPHAIQIFAALQPLHTRAHRVEPSFRPADLASLAGLPLPKEIAAAPALLRAFDMPFAQPLSPFAPAPEPLAQIATAAAPAAAELLMEHQLDLAADGAWLDQLAQDIAAAGEDGTPLRFRLNPETLGSLRVEITQDRNGATVRLTADTEAARAIITDAQPRLLAEARAQGVRISEAHVDLGNGSASGDARRQQQAEAEPQLRTARLLQEDGEPDGKPTAAGSDLYA